MVLRADKKLAVWFWASIAILTLGALYILQDILLPFVLGFVIAYLLDPVVDKLGKLGKRKGWRKIFSRSTCTLIALAIFTTVIVSIISLLVPVLQSQVRSIVQSFPQYMSNFIELIRPYYEPFLSEVSQDPASIKDIAGKQMTTALTILDGAFGKVIESGSVLLSLFSVVIVTPIVSYYLLRDWDGIVAKVDGWLPREEAPIIRQQIRLIDDCLSGFVRGQGMVCLCLGTFYATVLSIIGLEFGLTIGLFTGLMSFVPYFGSGLGLLISMLVAVKQFPDWFSVGLVLGTFIVGQILEGYVLSPRLVGERVGLHAVWIIFALMAGGSLFGFVGILLAVPVAATLGVLFRFIIDQYKDSPIYRGRK
ncbi:MAG: AI-2E family transporter [Alphaproteobacteria bacterium]|nr:MAG: AI-2E family transporter [Alphaproteobacteria bacterium]